VIAQRPNVWIARGESLWDAHESLRTSAIATLRGQRPAALWMSDALGLLRGTPLATDFDPRATDRAIARKYALATTAALAAGVGCAASHAPSLVTLNVAALAFYAVEVRQVFLVPCAIDGAREDPAAESAALLRAQGGLAWGLRRVIPIAAHMLTGGLRGQGALRSWCAGCIAVLCWYEVTRAIAERAPRPTPEDSSCAIDP
jgi:hypothetical protein